MKDLFFRLTADDAALGRLDRILLAHAPDSTRALVAEAFSAGRVRLGGRPVRKSDRGAEGALLEVSALAETTDRAVAPDPALPLSVVYEDPQVLAFDKPAGQACHPVSIGEGGTLASALLARYPELEGIGDDPLMPGLLHRLDAGTSGLVLAARSPAAFAALRAQFTAHTARKVYLALVEGTVEKPGGVSGHLAHSSSFRGRMRCIASGSLPKGERALFAETFYKPRWTRGGTTLLEVTILTGVTHQIRCQLSSIGHPIVGDATYGAHVAPGLPGHRLHALSATIVHPATGKPIMLRTPEPAWAK